MNRRNFIKLSLITSVSLYANKTKKVKSKTLILIELDGANDSLNTFVPYSSKVYYDLRPDIAIKKDDLNIINKDFGLNKNLNFLYNSFKNKELAIINGLGYDKPNLSHFKSIQIVETNNTKSINGWLSDILKDNNLNDLKPAHALVIGKKQRTFLFSNDLNILQIKSFNNFIKKSNKFTLKNNITSFLDVQNNIIVRSNHSLKKHIDDDKPDFQNKLQNDLYEALKIIKSPIHMPVIKVAQKGYDTHADQVNRQSILLKDLDNALEYFVEDLKKHNLYDDVLIVTYSEFSRRVKQNSSLGTDHGTASSHFVLGGLVNGGIYGKHPSLDNLDKNNLIYTTHYGSLYNSILSSWFKDTNNKFNKYDKINFI